MKHIIFLVTTFCLFLSYSIFAQDSIVIKTSNDIHLASPESIGKGVPYPNDGNAKMICIAGFKC